MVRTAGAEDQGRKSFTLKTTEKRCVGCLNWRFAVQQITSLAVSPGATFPKNKRLPKLRYKRTVGDC